MNAIDKSGDTQLPLTLRVFERGWLSSNNILFTGPQTALIDSGYVSHAPQTLALVQHALQGAPLDLLINTHLHSDHCGGNATLQQAFGSRTLIPAAEADKVSTWNTAALSFGATGQQCPRFTFDGVLNAGDVLQLGGLDWQALGSSGHDPHSLIFYCAEERILISADALWENGFGVIFPELEGESGFTEARATLELIAGLDIRLVIPGHGAPFSNVQQALDIAFSRLDYFIADPMRNAQNAVKVMLKFILLERRQIALSVLPSILSQAWLFGVVNERFLKKTQDELAQWLTARLVRAGAAEVTDGILLNVD